MGVEADFPEAKETGAQSQRKIIEIPEPPRRRGVGVTQAVEPCAEKQWEAAGWPVPPVPLCSGRGPDLHGKGLHGAEGVVGPNRALPLKWATQGLTKRTRSSRHGTWKTRDPSMFGL